MDWKEEDMDLILVPSGLLIMLLYHLHLLYRSIYLPHTTAVGYENHCRCMWINDTMKLDVQDRGQCKDVITSTIATTTYLATMSIVLGSLMGTWIGSASDANIFKLKVIYGSTSPSITTIKYICIFACFLAAFTAFLQSAKHYIHANFLITMPVTVVPVTYVQREVLRGFAYWSLGIRAIYFAITLSMWVFGPIIFFFTCVIMVLLLYILDGTNLRGFHGFVTEGRRADDVLSRPRHRKQTGIGQSEAVMTDGSQASMAYFAAF